MFLFVHLLKLICSWSFTLANYYETGKNLFFSHEAGAASSAPAQMATLPPYPPPIIFQL